MWRWPSGEAIQLVNGRAEALPFPDAAFDALTFTYLLRYVDDPQSTLIELARVVRPGALVASLEFMVPPSRSGAGCGGLHASCAAGGGLATGGLECIASVASSVRASPDCIGSIPLPGRSTRGARLGSKM